MEPNKKSENVDKFKEIYKETERHRMKLYSDIVKKDICTGMKRLSLAYSIFLKKTKQSYPTFSMFVSCINRQIFKKYNSLSVLRKEAEFESNFKPFNYKDYEEKVQNVINNKDIYEYIVQKSKEKCGYGEFSYATTQEYNPEQLLLESAKNDFSLGMSELNRAYSIFVDKYRDSDPTFSLFVDSILTQIFKNYNPASLAKETVEFVGNFEQIAKSNKKTSEKSEQAFSGQRRMINNERNSGIDNTIKTYKYGSISPK